MLSLQAVAQGFASVTSRRQQRQSLTWITASAFVCINITTRVLKVGREETIPFTLKHLQQLQNPPPQIHPLLWNCVCSKRKSASWSSSVLVTLWNEIKIRGLTQNPTQCQCFLRHRDLGFWINAPERQSSNLDFETSLVAKGCFWMEDLSLSQVLITLQPSFNFHYALSMPLFLSPTTHSTYKWSGALFWRW